MAYFSNHLRENDSVQPERGHWYGADFVSLLGVVERVEDSGDTEFPRFEWSSGGTFRVDV